MASYDHAPPSTFVLFSGAPPSGKRRHPCGLPDGLVYSTVEQRHARYRVGEDGLGGAWRSVGKKAKKQGQTAIAQSNGLHSVPDRPTPPAHGPGFTPGKTILTADVVTGEPLRPDTLKYRVGYVRVDWQPTTQQREDGWQNDTSDVPQAVSSAKVEHLSRLGGRADTPGWRKYIGDAKPTTVIDAEAELHDWWRTQYGISRVRDAFIESKGPKRGRQAFWAAYLVRAQGQPEGLVAALLEHTVTWVRQQCKSADFLMTN